jgi:hypothetical protein
MTILTGDAIKRERLPGREIRKAIGKGAALASAKMTMGFVRYSAESGPMEPHNHAEEVLYILSSKSGWVRFGPAYDRLDDKLRLEAGMLIHFPELEWHVFGYDEGGSVEAIFFYGQVDNIRPEEIAVWQRNVK